jgi:hypothetical protein
LTREWDYPPGQFFSLRHFRWYQTWEAPVARVGKFSL